MPRKKSKSTKKVSSKKKPTKKGSVKRKKPIETIPSQTLLHPPAGSPDPFDGVAAEADDIAGEILADEDGYLTPTSLPEPEQETVVVQDFDPADPGAPLAEPQKVLKPHDRIARKRARGSRE